MLIFHFFWGSNKGELIIIILIKRMIETDNIHTFLDNQYSCSDQDAQLIYEVLKHVPRYNKIIKHYVDNPNHKNIHIAMELDDILGDILICFAQLTDHGKEIFITIFKDEMTIVSHIKRVFYQNNKAIKMEILTDYIWSKPIPLPDSDMKTSEEIINSCNAGIKILENIKFLAQNVDTTGPDLSAEDSVSRPRCS